MNFRPQNLSEFVGQDALRPVLQNAIVQAKSGRRLFGPTLLYGGPGLGKSSLAAVIAMETATKLLSYTGSVSWTGPKIKKLLLNLDVRGYKPGGVWQEGATRYTLFFDEIHANHPSSWEAWYSPLEDLEIRDNGKAFWLPDIQFIFATTLPTKLPKPFLDRLPLQLHLEPYTVDDLCKIVSRLQPKMPSNNVENIASRSCGVARLAINYAQAVADYPGGLEWLTIMGIDQDGLTTFHRKYLAVLDKVEGRTISLSALASVLREAPAVVQLFEEELLRQGRIEIGPHGRSLATVREPGGKIRE